MERDIHLPHCMLQNFIGYGAFVTETDNSALKTNDIKAATFVNAGAEGRRDGKDSTDKSPTNPRGRQLDHSNTLFIACTGIYIDVYKIKPEQ
ncbi:hypothetical protein BGX34_008616, partial [Mortierella sp. NVP85]